MLESMFTAGRCRGSKRGGIETLQHEIRRVGWLIQTEQRCKDTSCVDINKLTRFFLIFSAGVMSHWGAVGIFED